MVNPAVSELVQLVDMHGRWHSRMVRVLPPDAMVVELSDGSRWAVTAVKQAA